MVALSDRKIEIVKTLVESAPDKIVGGLRMALAESVGDSVLATVRQLVEAEAEDRMLRNAVFQPVAPLFVGNGSARDRLTFPTQTLAMMWRGLKAGATPQMAAVVNANAAVAAAMASEQRLPDPSAAYNALLKQAAVALRAREQREFRVTAEMCDAARPGGAEVLAACLDIAHIVRKTLPRLPEWVAQTSDETSAPARLAYKDAVAVAEDAGPRFFEMLASQMTPHWMVLRIISAIMEKPTERYLSESELGGFPERVMDEIDASLKAIGKLDRDGGPEAGRAAGRLVELVTQQTFELEACIELTRDHGWGHRIFDQKKALASLAESHLRDIDKLVAAALPNQSSGFARGRKSGPKLDQAPDAKAVARAMTALTFAHEIRLCANYGGFSAMHAKTVEKLGGVLDHYVEEVLDHARTGDAPPAIALAFLSTAADMVALIRDEKAAELVRRRAASACAAPDGPPDRSVMLDA